MKTATLIRLRTSNGPGRSGRGGAPRDVFAVAENMSVLVIKNDVEQQGSFFELKPVAEVPAIHLVGVVQESQRPEAAQSFQKSATPLLIRGNFLPGFSREIRRAKGAVLQVSSLVLPLGYWSFFGIWSLGFFLTAVSSGRLPQRSGHEL